MGKRHPDQQWKKAERFLARLFGSDRRALSGSSNANTAEGNDDGCHENLYLESKYAKYHPIYTLYLKCKEAVQHEAKLAHRRGKGPRIPVIGLRQARLQGCLLVVHSDDLPRLVEEYMAANKADVLVESLSQVGQLAPPTSALGHLIFEACSPGELDCQAPGEPSSPHRSSPPKGRPVQAKTPLPPPVKRRR